MSGPACRTDTAALTSAGFAAALLDPTIDCPAGLFAWNGADPTQRFSVHRNTVISSLVDCLAQTYPVSQALVGETFFRAMAAVFVRTDPPRSPILADYGAGLPAFIEEFAPAQSVPYLADLARLEFARLRALHSADSEPVSAQTIQCLLASGVDPAMLDLRLHESLALIESPWAIVSIWAAHQGDGTLGPVEMSRPETALVLRDGLEVILREVSPAAAAFIGALRDNETLGEACARATALQHPFELDKCLALLVRHRVITAVQTAGANP